MPSGDGPHPPIRTCIGCRKKRAKSMLIRLALDEEGQVVWDIKQVLPGRGAYLCSSRTCLKAALKARRFARTFGRSVSIARLTSPGSPWSEESDGKMPAAKPERASGAVRKPIPVTE